MFVKLGSAKYIDTSRIVGIFDMDTATVCAATRVFLSRAQREGRVSLADEDIPKSFVLADGKKRKAKKYIRKDRGEEKKCLGNEVILCKLASGVLYGRIGAELDTLSADEE